MYEEKPKKKLFSVVGAAVLFLLSFAYLVVTAFDSKEALGAKQTGVNVLEVYEAVLDTNHGQIVVRFYDSDAPKTKANFVSLASTRFYDGTKFHRVIKGFMIQGGDPYTIRDDVSRYGTGDPGYTIKDEINDRPMVRGAVAMANAGKKNTAGSQFFILTNDRPDLEGKYTVFGYVGDGMKVVDAISAVPVDSEKRPVEPVIVKSVVLRK